MGLGAEPGDADAGAVALINGFAVAFAFFLVAADEGVGGGENVAYS